MSKVDASQSNQLVNVGQSISTISKVDIIDYVAYPYFIDYEGITYKDGVALDTYYRIYGNFDYSSDAALYESNVSSIYYTWEVLGSISLTSLDVKVKDIMNDPNVFWDMLLAKNNTIIGSRYNDNISTKAGADYIDSGAGNDNIYANEDADLIIAGAGDDKLYGGQGGDILYGNQGADKLYGNFQDDVLYGGQDNDWQHGGQGADWLYGNFGIDEMYGGRDNDLLHGGRENDKLWGNHGADKFFLSKGQDQVMDFNAAEGDLISLPAGTAYSLAQQGTDLLIDAALGDLLLVNISKNDFNASSSIVVG
ncbi:Hemolysin, chromosomal [Prochlorococcus marinus str. MIT 1318]|uniref:calcium-binding protein n=1 Tax=Prochlorococcus TaxID=1218 RepID=UPI0007B3BFFC|nr:calcium-binding protein [Prochlorococcus marinus]KZR73039.1 Hemolysin, chromosomal [Prochlorococcus marinus str. MIT 1318]